MEQVPVALFLSSWLPVFGFLSLGISLFWITPIDGFRQYLSFVFLVCFAEYNIFKVHPNCSMCQNFLIMDEYYSVVCLHHCAIYWFLCGWTLDLLWSFGYCEWCSNEHWYNNIYLSPFFPFFFSWYLPRSGIAGSCDYSVFNSLKTCKLVFPSGCTISHSHQHCVSALIAPRRTKICYFAFW